MSRYPGHLPAGKVNEDFLTVLELFPSFTKLAGATLPEEVIYDGFDFLPVLAGEVSSPRKEMFWERRDQQAARIGNYKWVKSSRGGGLFDLDSDPGEKHDLSKSNPEILSQIKQRFRDWKSEMNASEPRGPFRDY
ncbi:MAG: hypothetical protein R3C11_03900 [Planctomycetaceae bacterium]